jgi:hypothetical protein
MSRRRVVIFAAAAVAIVAVVVAVAIAVRPRVSSVSSVSSDIVQTQPEPPTVDASPVVAPVVDTPIIAPAPRPPAPVPAPTSLSTAPATKLKVVVPKDKKKNKKPASLLSQVTPSKSSSSPSPSKSSPSPSKPSMTSLPPATPGAPLVVAGKSWSGVDLDAFFGGKIKDKALLAAMVADPQLVIRAWQTLTDDVRLWKKRGGIDGPFYALGGNSNLEVFGETLGKQAQLSSSWKRAVATSFGKNLLDANGLIASSARRADPDARAGWSWSFGYQFHFFRKRWQGQLGSDAIGLTWPGGPTGAGSRLLRHIFVDEYNFIKPTAAGQTTRTLPVHAGWGAGDDRVVPRSVLKRVRDGQCEFPCGVALGWRDKVPAYHGAWDALCVLNQLFVESGGASVFALIPDAVKPRIGSAMANLVAMANAKADDMSGYKPSGDGSWDHWRMACMEEFPKKGVQYVLKNFGRL